MKEKCTNKLFDLGFVKVMSSPYKGVIRGVFLANQLASIDNLNRTTKRQDTYKHKSMLTQKCP